jgi:predicted helicase
MEQIFNYSIPFSIIQDYVASIQNHAAIDEEHASEFFNHLEKFLRSSFSVSKGFTVQVQQPDVYVYFRDIPLFVFRVDIPKSVPVNEILSNYELKAKEEMIKSLRDGVQLILTDFLNLYTIDPEEEQNYRIKQYPLIKAVSQDAKIALKDRGSPQNYRFIAEEKAAESLNLLIHKSIENKIIDSRKLENLIIPLAKYAQDLKSSFQTILTPASDAQLDGYEKYTHEFMTSIKNDFGNSLFKEEMENLDMMFADLFSQTIVYTAFSTWIKHCKLGKAPTEFKLSLLKEYLPVGSFLRSIFYKFSLNIPKSIEKSVNEIFELFRTADLKFHSNNETLISTFYSTFLRIYDPVLAKERGVVYTPYEIVNFIVQGIDTLLINEFNVEGGIINLSGKNKIRVLDPASGTMAFASGYLRYAYHKFRQLYSSQQKDAIKQFKKWFDTDFIENMNAFEILMAPYVLGYLRIFLTLEELGITLSEELNIKSFLMNTLMTPPSDEKLDAWLTDKEIEYKMKKALKIRDKEPIHIVMGNPPYNLSSQNSCKWIQEKLAIYKEGLDEGNLKILSDDYVKFIRFGQWRIEQTGQGILAYITNNKYLDGQVYHAMRLSLRKSFDKIFIVNLHGDMRKREKGNPFDISVGVAIAFMVKKEGDANTNSNGNSNGNLNRPSNRTSNEKKLADVYYMDVPHDSREEKFARISRFDFSDFILLPETKKHYFVPMNFENIDRYESFVPINSLFKRDPISGVMVGRDKLLTDIDPERLKTKINMFFDRKFDELKQMGIVVEDTKSWSIDKVFEKTNRKSVLNSIKMMRYSGFDFRYVAYDKGIVEGHRSEVMSQVSDDNLILCVSKSSRLQRFDNAMISNILVEKTFMCKRDTAYAFIFDFESSPNFIVPQLGFNPSRFDFLAYVYAILHSEIYRKRYNEFLLKEFPKIPITKNEGLFKEMASLGSELINAHLLRNPVSSTCIIHTGSSTDWTIEKVSYAEAEQRIYLDKPNRSKRPQDRIYIEKITQEQWNYTIGCEKQLSKFLESRVGSKLSNFDIEYLFKICTAIEKTLVLKREIDEVYKKIDNIEDSYE